MWQTILESLQNFWNWLMDLLAKIGHDAINWILSLLPLDFLQKIEDSTSAVGWALQLANAWVPLDIVFSYVLVFVVFIVAWLAAKILLKLIP